MKLSDFEKCKKLAEELADLVAASEAMELRGVNVTFFTGEPDQPALTVDWPNEPELQKVVREIIAGKVNNAMNGLEALGVVVGE